MANAASQNGDGILGGFLHVLADGLALTEAESSTVAAALIRGEISPIRLAALLTAFRVRGETADELLGFVRAMRSAATALNVVADELVDTCGTGGDGAGTFNISTVAAIVAAGAGCKIAKHGARASSSRSGSADVLEALGVNIQQSPEQSARLLNELGLAFLFAPQYHPGARHAAPIRRELGFRTLFNLVGPLLNPAGATRQVMGVYDARLTGVVAEVLRRLGSRHALIVCGADGLDEITLSAATRVAELREGHVRAYEVTPEDFGVSRMGSLEVLRGGTPADNAAIARAILAGERGPRREVVLINAAAAIYVAGRAGTLREGVPLAAASIDSGAAAAILDGLARATNI